jgi:peptidoglycan hydrolase-like amidase
VTQPAARELAKIGNEKYPVQAFRAVDLGEPDPGGGLRWAKIAAASRSEVARKEFNSRLAFGKLFSTMLMVIPTDPAHNRTVFTFSGGYQGHGGGPCQDGAHGRAPAAEDCADILRGYFPGPR